MGLSNAPEHARGLSSVLGKHSAVHARGSTGPSSCGWADQGIDPALWEDGVLRELPAGAPASDSRQSAPSGPSPSGPSSGRSGFGARLMDMTGDWRRHAVAARTACSSAAARPASVVRRMCWGVRIVSVLL
jgi:hypothetical protein